MKKGLIALLAFLFCLTLPACGKQETRPTCRTRRQSTPRRRKRRRRN